MMRPEDALEAARVGADAIGMIFHPPAGRNISLQRASEIVSALPAFVTPVGVFVDAPTERVLEIADELRLRHVQLHGNESPDDVLALRDLKVLKALRVEKETFAERIQTWRQAIVQMRLSNLVGFVLETPGTTGGSGVANDWDTVTQHRGAAGGLTPDTVGPVIRALRPWAVDVSSGVETNQRGIKSPEKIEAFVKAVREADTLVPSPLVGEG